MDPVGTNRYKTSHTDQTRQFLHNVLIISDKEF